MRKCAQCGCDIPSWLTSCSNCGYNPDHIQQTYAFGKSTKNQGNNNGNKVGKIILIIFLLIFFAPFIVSIIFFILAFFIFSPSMFDDLDPDDYDEIGVCETYCGADYVEMSGECYCGNGAVYDEDGNFIYNSNYPNDENINLTYPDVGVWQYAINTSEKVVTLLCDNTSYGCDIMTDALRESARRNGYIVFRFNVDLLAQSDIDKIKSAVNIDLYYDIHPFTFVVENEVVLGQKNGIIYEEELDEWLETMDVVR